MVDVIVIGGGIVGTATAYHLAADGVDTLLVDRDDPGRATDAGAGIVSPESSRHESDVWYEFAVEAAAYYPDLVGELRSLGIDNIGYGDCAVLVVDLPDYDPAAFMDARQRVYERQSDRNHPADDTLYDVSPADAQRLFPPLADIHQAFYYEDGARVNGRTFESALRDAGTKHGLRLLRGNAEEIILDSDTVTGVTVDGNRYVTSQVVVAGGAWSGAFADQLDIEIPVEPQRGQIVHLATDADTTGWPIVSTVQGHYLVPWDDGRVAAGATRETGSGFVPHPTADGVRQVLDDALRTAPGLAAATIEEIRVGLRPLSGDGLPIIGPVSDTSGAYIVTGHGPTGLTLGPYSGKCIADLILGEPIDTGLDAFAPSRFM